MSTLSQFLGGDNILIGQTIPMVGALNYFTNNNQEYLKTGFAKAYSTNYSTFKTRVPAGCFVSINKINNSVTNPLAAGAVINVPSFNRIYYNGSNYIYASSAINSAGSWLVYTSSNYTSWTNQTGNFTQPSSFTVKDSCMAGTTLMLCGRETTGNNDIQWMTAAGTFSSVTPTKTLVSIDASSTLIVSIQGASSTGAGNIVTQPLTGNTPGGATVRTGTGGATAFTMGQVFYSPVSSAFFTLSSPGTSISMNKSTDGFTFTSVWDTDYTFTMTNVGKEYVANSGSYSVISGIGKIRWTNNGTTWNTIDLTTLNVGFQLSSTTQYSMYHSPVTNKFYLSVGFDSTNRLTYYISTSDFVNWNTEFVQKDLVTSDTRGFGIFGVNSKNLSICVKSSTFSPQDVYDITTQLSATNPDYVGSMIQSFSSTLNGYVRIA